ncbi:MAG: CBS domain-containing protein [Actinomycetota bacterium]|nr:CBS domain-containing protein [Actinomycetota bacterium]
MPPYREVAQLPVGDLLEDRDEPVAVHPMMPLQDVAGKLGATPARAVIVTRDGLMLGVVGAADIVNAVADGLDGGTPIKVLLEQVPRPVTVSYAEALERLPRILGDAGTIVVTDDAGKPKGVVRRADLAERVRHLA